MADRVSFLFCLFACFHALLTSNSGSRFEVVNWRVELNWINSHLSIGPQEWLACDISLWYYSWFKHSDQENTRNDYHLGKRLIVKDVLLVRSKGITIRRYTALNQIQYLMKDFAFLWRNSWLLQPSYFICCICQSYVHRSYNLSSCSFWFCRIFIAVINKNFGRFVTISSEVMANEWKPMKPIIN